MTDNIILHFPSL